MRKEDIMRMIEEEGVEFVRLQFTDIFGRLKNIAVTAPQMEKVFANRYSFYGSAIFGNKYDYDDKLYLYPDLDTFSILPWRPQQGKVAKIVCDICLPDGTLFAYSPRHILKEACRRASDEGYSLIVDPECEFFLFHTDENGLPTTTSHEMAEYLDVGPSDFGENARRDIVLMLEEMGFDIESSHHEYAPAQHEIDFKEDDALTMADSIQTFKFAVRSIAKRFGLYATFMPKPRQDVAGSGMHINLKLEKDGRNVFRSQNGDETDEARWFIGGIMAHARALCAVSNPSVNSYKRILSGYSAPDTITWDTKGEKALVVLNKEADDVKIELRFPDGSANPYLLFAACMEAGFDGIKNRTDPGKSYRETDLSQAGRLPVDLREAVEEFEKDETVTGSLGEEFSSIYSKIKRTEWRDFMSNVTQWEIDNYLTRL
ncbi:MAG: glutamine synthetase family protein [Lachnospiraceae bacterium]|nr:glutamine synthetase family protein [Lachnospiraceae bacterium]